MLFLKFYRVLGVFLELGIWKNIGPCLSVMRYFLCLADEPPAEDDSTETPITDVMRADMTLAAEENDNVTISCKNEHNGTVDQVLLEKMPHGQTWSIIGECEKHDLLTKDYRDVPGLRCTDTLDVSLQLTSVGQQDGGFYRCTFSTDAGLQTTTVLLTVSPSGTKQTACLWLLNKLLLGEN